MNITLNKDDIEFLNKVIQESRYYGCLKAKCILDKLTNKDIHEGDRIKVVKVLAAADKYKNLLGKRGIVLKVDDFIDVQIDDTVYYLKREEIEVIQIDHINNEDIMKEIKDVDRLTRGVVCNITYVDESTIFSNKRKRVVCIDNSYSTDYLTEHRIYTVIKEDERYYTIIDDINAMSDYLKNRFVLLDEDVKNNN